MRRTEILLAILVVAIVVGLAFGPALLEKWRADDSAETEVAVEAESPDSAAQSEVASAKMNAELERVTGILMLHQACVNRFQGFDAKARPIMEAWKNRHAETLERRGGEPDFHIVLAPPPGGKDAAGETPGAEERALCERNLDVMKADLERAPAR